MQTVNYTTTHIFPNQLLEFVFVSRFAIRRNVQKKQLEILNQQFFNLSLFSIFRIYK